MEGIRRSTRNEPPTHFRLKIESFSTLLSSSQERYESCEFETGSYRWKLALYPNGNKKRDGKDHISLYLLASDESRFDLNKEVPVTLSLFVFDHIRDKYLALQEVTRFHSMKCESGFDQFLPLTTFKDPSKGYLVDDTCMFGAEVFVIGNTITGQCLTMIEKKHDLLMHTWKIEKFSALKNEAHYSEMFMAGGHEWKMLMYPKGRGTGEGSHLSLYLSAGKADTALPAGKEVLVEYKLRVVNQVSKVHKEIGTTVWLCETKKDWGWPEFLPLSELNSSSGYLVNDVCILEAEVAVRGSARNWN